MTTTFHSNVPPCPICERVGDEGVNDKHFVTCPAYRALVHMAHCMQCPYHQSDCSVDWCRYKTKEQKIKERKEQYNEQRMSDERRT